MASDHSVLALFRRSVHTSGWRWAASLALDRVGVPALGWWRDQVYAADALAEQVRQIFRTWGMPEDHIAITTEHLLYADLHGIDSHGCAMLWDYHRNLVAGRLTMTPKVEVVRDGPTTALVDGGGGLGHMPADLAMKLAIAKCHETGMGSVAVRNSGHYGAAGAYAAMAAREGVIGLATTNTRTPSVVPTFGVEPMLGTNPIAVSAPTTKNRPFLLDMATSTAPIGKLMIAWRAGKRIPEGWAQDPQGRPVTNARKASKYRRLTPLGSSRLMGSHKGYGLATVVELLSSILPGLREAQGEGPARAGHFFMAIDPRRFRDNDAFQHDLDAMMDAFRNSRSIDPRRPVLVAGDPEYAAADERSRTGIPLSRFVVEDMRLICRESKAPFTLGVR
jgi:LDH2 family malate/lactate/ureidoglycolate dehydrogenase